MRFKAVFALSISLIVLFFLPRSALALHTISGGEYFFDIDPGEGNGISLSAKDGTFNSIVEEIDMEIDISNLTIGPHFLNIRMKNENGVWGIPRKHLIMVTGNKTITLAEYFFDADPGAGNGIPIAQTNGKILTEIDVSSLSSGLHKLYVRMKDSENMWGEARQYTFEVFNSSASGYITNAEHYIDTDPGVENGIPLSATDGNFDEMVEDLMGEIDTDNLSIGIHTAYVRAKQSNGLWTRPAKAISFNVVEQSTIPVLSSPPDRSTVTKDDLTFTWFPALDAVSYELLVDNNTDFTSPEIHKTNISGTIYTHTSILNETDYFWKVRAKLYNGSYSDWSVIWQFYFENNLMGDIDSDGSIDLADAINVLKILCGITVQNVNINSDVNSDGKIGIEEAIYILQHISNE